MRLPDNARASLNATFILKLIFVAAALCFIGSCLILRYRIGVDSQQHPCLPDHRVYLIDLKDKTVTRDGLYAVKTTAQQPYLPHDTWLVKRVVGLPGDVVRTRKEGVYINEKRVSEGYALTSLSDIEPIDYQQPRTLQSDELWLVGDTEDSYDARYWGPISTHQVEGRVWPLF